MPWSRSSASWSARIRHDRIDTPRGSSRRIKGPALRPMGAAVAWQLRHLAFALARPAGPPSWLLSVLAGRRLFDALLQAVTAVPSRPRARDRTTMLASDAGKRYWLLDLSAYRDIGRLRRARLPHRILDSWARRSLAVSASVRLSPRAR